MSGERMRRRLERLESRPEATGRPIFLHEYQPAESPEEVEANRRAAELRREAHAAGRPVVTFRHVAAPLGERAALAGHE